MNVKTKLLISIIGVAIISLSASHLVYLNTMTASETYPEDSFLSTVPVKNAVIVTAHDDDAYSFAGTIFKLVSQGWSVRQISLSRKEKEKNELFFKIAKLEQLSGVDLLTSKYRNDLDTNKAPYMPIPNGDFPKVFNHDIIYGDLEKLLDEIKPQVIFSLDDSIGGYGHPDHVFISKLVVEYCAFHKNLPGFTVKKIYQAVFPPSMAEQIMVKNSWSTVNPYITGKKVYHVNGMPLPDVCIDIRDFGTRKKEYMNSYSKHDRKNISKVAPYYNWYPAWLYFRMFSKEYFRTIDVS